MTPFTRGLLIAALQVALVAALGGKLLYDRANLPRVWALTVPVDPDLPLRGRYVQLRVVVEVPEQKLPERGDELVAPAVSLRVAEGELVGDPVAEDDPRAQALQYVGVDEVAAATLAQPLAFFIPEHVPDPSRRAEGESLWVEVTVPRRGPPRPIRLGVQQGDGPIVPLLP